MPTLIQEIFDDICSELLNGKQYDAKAVYTFALAGKENWEALERFCASKKSLCLIDFCNENADSRTVGNKILKFQVTRLIDLLGNSLECLNLPFIISDNYSTFVERLIDTICEAQKLVELSTDTVSILTQITNKCSKSLKRIKTRCYALPSEPPRDLYLDSLDLQVHNVHNLKEILEKCYRTKSLTLDLFNNLSCTDLVSQFDGVQNAHFYALRHLKLCLTDKYRLYFTSMHKIFECCAAFPSLESFDLVVKDFKGISYPPISEIVAEFYNVCEVLSARNYKFNVHFTWQIFLKMDKLFKQMKGEFDGFELSSDNMILPIYTKSVSLTPTKTAILKFKFY